MRDTVPLGTILPWVGDYAPEGWALCDGRLLFREDFPDLFMLLREEHGGDGVRTFAVPDLRGAVLVGAGAPAPEGAVRPGAPMALPAEIGGPYAAIRRGMAMTWIIRIEGALPPPSPEVTVLIAAREDA